MTAAQKLNAIAEACGWTSKKVPPDDQNPYGEFQHTWWLNPLNPERYPHPLPDYLTDLNAMHEAEKVLRNDQFHYTAYWRHLFQVVAGKAWAGDIGYFHFEMTHATAAQRAEAFLRTLGKWID